MQSYIDMIKYCRPAGSATEEAFIERFLTPLGVSRDGAGNLIKRIGAAPVLWSCHTDTVHHDEGFQKVSVVDDFVVLDKDSTSNCLGADCTTGVWLMVEMIKANVEGLYIFHRGEECGGIGSDYIAKKTPELLKDIKFAIAFDRYATKSVITHQFGRCASDEFADSLIEQFPGFEKDDGGVFTDTANYTDLIGECTNVSVGYYGHHGKTECQDLRHMTWLLDKLVSLDVSKLTAKREPGEEDWSAYRWRSYKTFNDFDFEEDFYPVHRTKYLSPSTPPDRKAELIELIVSNPDAIADLLDQYGLTATDVEAYIYA